MYEYIKHNKEWLFSGIGVVVILGILSFLKFAFFDSGARDQGTHVLHQGKPADAPKKTNITQDSFSPITLEEFIDILANKNITGLQRQDFIKKHEGRIVRWRGIVDNVTQTSSADPEGDIIVIYRPITQKGENLPDLFAARFPFTARQYLSSFSQGDYIEFEGKLRILSRETSPSPALSNCVLLKYVRAKDFKTP
jgi:hypothetical protein